MSFVRVLALLSVLAIVGCGSGENATPVEPPTADSQIKSSLEYVAESGQVDSGIMLVREQLEELKETDAAKADALLKDLDELETMAGNPDGAKAKASEMLKKL